MGHSLETPGYYTTFFERKKNPALIFQGKLGDKPADLPNPCNDLTDKPAAPAAANPLAALFPPAAAGLQQMQQLLQSQLANGNFNPSQLQHIMQQHSILSQHQVQTGFIGFKITIG